MYDDIRECIGLYFTVLVKYHKLFKAFKNYDRYLYPTNYSITTLNANCMLYESLKFSLFITIRSSSWPNYFFKIDSKNFELAPKVYESEYEFYFINSDDIPEEELFQKNTIYGDLDLVHHMVHKFGTENIGLEDHFIIESLCSTVEDEIQQLKICEECIDSFMKLLEG